MTEIVAVSANILLERPSGRLLAADTVACEVFAVEPDWLTETHFSDLGLQFDADRWHSLLDQNDKLTRHFRMTLTIDGESKEADVLARSMHGMQGPAVLLTFQFGGSQEQEILHRDALTGLADRRDLQSQYDLLARTLSGQGRSVALVFLDLDHFKQVNDELGHAVGDEVLIALARRWEGCVRDRDLVARYGGDEFVFLLADIDSQDAARPVLDRLAQATQQPMTISEHQVQISATLGLAIGNTAATGLKDLLLCADREMYSAKESSGRT